MEAALTWLKKYGLGWEFAIDFGLLLLDLGRRLAEQDGVAPDVLAAREAAAQQRMGRDVDTLIDDLRGLVKS